MSHDEGFIYIYNLSVFFRYSLSLSMDDTEDPPGWNDILLGKFFY